MAKKKKRDDESEEHSQEPSCVNGTNSDKKKIKKKKEKSKELKEKATVSIALPGSIIHNAQSLELATRVCLPSRHSLYLNCLILCL